jgi:hypothetical protein
MSRYKTLKTSIASRILTTTSSSVLISRPLEGSKPLPKSCITHPLDRSVAHVPRRERGGGTTLEILDLPERPRNSHSVIC